MLMDGTWTVSVPSRRVQVETKGQVGTCWLAAGHASQWLVRPAKTMYVSDQEGRWLGSPRAMSQNLTTMGVLVMAD